MRRMWSQVGRLLSKISLSLIPSVATSVIAGYIMTQFHLVPREETPARTSQAAVVDPAPVVDRPAMREYLHTHHLSAVEQQDALTPAKSEAAAEVPLPRPRPDAAIIAAQLTQAAQPVQAAAPVTTAAVQAPADAAPYVPTPYTPTPYTPTPYVPAPAAAAPAPAVAAPPAVAVAAPVVAAPAAVSPTIAPPMAAAPTTVAAAPPVVARQTQTMLPPVTVTAPRPVEAAAADDAAQQPRDLQPAAPAAPERGLGGHVFSAISSVAGGAANVTGNTINWVITLPGRALGGMPGKDEAASENRRLM